MLVVGADNGVVDEEEGGSRVGDGLDGALDGFARADFVAGGGVAPEALAVVDGGVGDGAGVLGVVNVAEVVATWGTLLEVGGEERGVEEGLGIGKEGLLLVRGDGVDAGEPEAEETVAGILDKLGGDGRGGFNSLAGDGGTTNIHGVGVHIARSRRLVAIGDAPGLAG